LGRVWLDPALSPEPDRPANAVFEKRKVCGEGPSAVLSNEVSVPIPKRSETLPKAPARPFPSPFRPRDKDRPLAA
jgi:hypothetical protein